MKGLFQRRKFILWRIPTRKGPPQGSIREAVDALWEKSPPPYYIKFSSIVEILENEKGPQPTVKNIACQIG